MQIDPFPVHVAISAGMGGFAVRAMVRDVEDPECFVYSTSVFTCARTCADFVERVLRDLEGEGTGGGDVDLKELKRHG